jgi:hypothetical protein
MKTIVLVALLAAMGCSKKASGSDCDASIAKGMDSVAAMIKTRAPSPQMQETMVNLVGKWKVALIQRCTQDKWAPDALACFAKVASRLDEQACEAKLTEEQRAKLHTDLRQAGRGSRMPGGLTGHPAMLSGTGSAGAAPAESGMAPAGLGMAPASPGMAPAGPGASPAGSGAAASGSPAPAPAPAGSGAAAASGSPAPAPAGSAAASGSPAPAPAGSAAASGSPAPPAGAKAK